MKSGVSRRAARGAVRLKLRLPRYEDGSPGMLYGPAYTCAGPCSSLLQANLAIDVGDRQPAGNARKNDLALCIPGFREQPGIVGLAHVVFDMNLVLRNQQDLRQGANPVVVLELGAAVVTFCRL